MIRPWIQLPDNHYDTVSNLIIHEVKCPVCGTHETYIEDHIPTECYICEEPRTLSNSNL
jgi:hypothetical protein